MSELRWILLAIGIVIVVLVYLWGRRTPGHLGREKSVARRAPELGSVDDSPPLDPVPPIAAVPEREPQRAVEPPPPAMDTTERPGDEHAEPQQESDPEPDAESGAPVDKVVILHLVPSEDEDFDAATVIAAIRAEGLRYGHFEIFHRFADEGNPGPDSQPLFSVANMLKPGSLELDKMRDARLKGVSLFIQIPGPPDPVAAFADMLATGRRLAATLDGRIVDSRGCAVSRQRASHLREDIVNYLMSVKIASGQEARSEA